MPYRDNSAVAGLEMLEPRLLLSTTPVANLSVDNPAADEATLTPAVIQISLDQPASVETKVKLSVQGTARRGREYTISQTVVVFEPGEMNKSVVVTPLDDARALGDHTVIVKIARGRGYVAGLAPSATVTLLDKEPTVTITALDAQAAETSLSQAIDTGTYRITQDSTQSVDVQFLMRGAAKALKDYNLCVGGIPISGTTVTVPPGPDGVDVTLIPIDDVVTRSNVLSAIMKLLPNVCYSLVPGAGGGSATVNIADNDASSKFAITSPDFRNGDSFSNGDFLISSPTFEWSNAPGGTQNFAFIVETPCPVFRPFVQWVAYNIPASTTSMSSSDLPSGATQGPNSLGLPIWAGPIAPPGTKHFYYFRLYALDADLDLPSGMNRAAVLSAIAGHVLGSTVITATCGTGFPVTNNIF